MSDYISKEKLISHIESEYKSFGEDYDALQILGDIEDFQTEERPITTEEIETVISSIEDEVNDLRSEQKEQYSYRAGYNDGINRAAILLRCFLKEKEEIK